MRPSIWLVSQRAGYAELWCLLYCWPEEVIEQTIALWVCFDALRLKWHYFNGIFIQAVISVASLSVTVNLLQSTIAYITKYGWGGWGCEVSCGEKKDHHGVSSGWSTVWHRSNTGLSSTQYGQIPIILGVWPFWLTPFFFRSITFWRAYGWIVIPLLKLLSFFWLTYYCSIGLCFSVRVSKSF